MQLRQFRELYERALLGQLLPKDFIRILKESELDVPVIEYVISEFKKTELDPDANRYSVLTKVAYAHPIVEFAPSLNQVIEKCHSF